MESNQETTATQLELELVENLRENLHDISLDKWHLETKNLIRFLRARNHSVENAEIMFRKVIEWRKKHDIDHILEWKPPPRFKSFWNWYVCGADKMGNPVLVMPMGLWDPAAVGKEGYDTFKMMKQVIMIIDCKDLSWRTVTTIDAMQGVVELFRCADANYPELLRLGYIVNAPFAFSLAWRLVKPFLSEHTQSKISIPSVADPVCWREDLLPLMEADQLPEQYGGDQPDGTEIEIEKG